MAHIATKRATKKHKVSRGEGGLDFLKDRNKWRKFYYVDQPNEFGIPERVQRSVTHESMTEAIRLAAERQKAAECSGPAEGGPQRAEEPPIQPTPPPMPHISYSPAIPVIERTEDLPAAAEGYIGSRVKFRSDGTFRGLKPNSAKRYRVYINNSRNPALGSLANIPMRDLSLDRHIAPHFLAYLRANDADTAIRYRGFLISVGSFAVDSRMWERNLFEKLPQVDAQALTRTKRILTPSEIDRLYATLLDRNFKRPYIRSSMLAAFRLLRLGLRPAEVFALSADDVLNDETLMISYAQTVAKPEWDLGDGFVWLDEPKTFASHAKVTVPTVWMREILTSAKRSLVCTISAYDDKSKRDGEPKSRRFLCPNLQGNIWLYNNACRQFKDLFRRAGLDVGVGGGNDRWLYCFRYTYASELYALGCSDVEAMALMRHRDAATSKIVYAGAREQYLDIYRDYREQIRNVTDYNKIIAAMDNDRIAKSGIWHRRRDRQTTIKDFEPTLLEEFGLAD